MREIGLHGRGGQGVVFSGEMLANAYFFEGYNVLFMPSYGAERRGSPSNAYVRIDEKERIHKRYTVGLPDAVVVFNTSLLDLIRVKEDGLVLLNSSEDIKKAGGSKARVFVVDANSIAVDLKLGTTAMPIINTALLGAFCRASADFSFDSLTKAIANKMGKNASANIEAAKRAYESVREI